MILSCGVAVAASAQTVIDPNFVEFTASPDHAVVTDGVAVVQRYDLLLYTAGAASASRTVNLGKPTPDGAGTIRLALGSLLSPAPAGGVTYEVRIAAVGPGGSAASSPSNGFSYQTACTYAVSPTSRSVGSGAGSSTFSVTAPAGCAWTATAGAGWLTFTSGATGSGNGTVAFAVSPNTGAASRSATLTIAGLSRTVTQAGTTCAYTVSPLANTVARAGGSVTVSVSAGSGCTWTASESSSWLSISAGSSGSGSGTVTFTVAAHTGTQARSATATVAGRTVSFSQAVAAPPRAPTGFRVVGSR